MKAIVTPGMLFEALGFRYFGPINGHNIAKLTKLFEHVKELKDAQSDSDWEELINDEESYEYRLPRDKNVEDYEKPEIE